MDEIKKYSVVKAVYSICNGLAVIIEGIEYGIDNYAVFRYSNDKRKRRAKLNYDADRQSYFFRSGKNKNKYYLDEFIRI